FNVSF
ncbi:unnamed protein product, partial [Allacma fusca]